MCAQTPSALTAPSTETREFQQKEQTAPKRLQNLKTRSKPLDQNKEQTARKRLEDLKTRSKPLERN